MKALDFFMDWLTEQKKSEQIYIAKELLKELDYFDHTKFVREELDRLDTFELKEIKRYVDESLENMVSDESL